MAFWTGGFGELWGLVSGVCDDNGGADFVVCE